METYEKLEMAIIAFEQDDVITESPDGNMGGVELPGSIL